MHRATAQAHADHPLRRAKPRDVIQDAVDAIADTYRDRLQTILEQQDGPGWIDALNHRRHVSMALGGKRAPRPYEFLEPRAVLNCLAYDPVGLQLISAPAATKARQLLGLVNEAHHPRPDAPLTEADGYRAWRLYRHHRSRPGRRPVRALSMVKERPAFARRRSGTHSPHRRDHRPSDGLPAASSSAVPVGRLSGGAQPRLGAAVARVRTRPARRSPHRTAVQCMGTSGAVTPGRALLRREAASTSGGDGV
jgi:hypothetical protein